VTGRYLINDAIDDALLCGTSQLRKLAFAIKNSSTALLPKWKAILNELQLEVRKMPRDVATRWNSTFAMLNFALEYRKAVQNITGDFDLDLRKYELSREEWTMAEQLRDVLKVRIVFFC
jgi:hypothetical protein